MISVLFSLLESSSQGTPNITVSMALTALYTWANDMFAAIPEYAMVDALLAALTLFHLFIAISFVSVADAFYKKPLMKLHRRLVKPFFDIPMMIPFFTLVLTVQTGLLFWRAYHNPDDGAVLLRAMISMYTWVCAIFLQKISDSLVKMGVDFALNAEQEIERHDIKAWKAPPKWTTNLFAPQNWLLRPEMIGAENIPRDSPGLYVMNHALYGMEMAPFVGEVYKKTNVYLRGLGDNIHFGQLHGEFIRYFGSVNGTRANVDALMENKDNVLVYPGGGHEIMKPCSVPKYTLMWKQRLGFARMAIKHGYPIIPCASVGTEDMMDRLFDIDLGFVRKDLKTPVVAVYPHKLQKVYFWFGEPISTEQYKGDWQNDEFAKEVRDKAKAAVEAGIRELQEHQAKDPNRFLFRHMANTIVDFCKNPFAKEEEATPASKKMD